MWSVFLTAWGNRERPVKVNHDDREELGPLEPPVDMAVDPVVLSCSNLGQDSFMPRFPGLHPSF